MLSPCKQIQIFDLYKGLFSRSVPLVNVGRKMLHFALFLLNQFWIIYAISIFPRPTSFTILYFASACSRFSFPEDVLCFLCSDLGSSRGTCFHELRSGYINVPVEARRKYSLRKIYSRQRSHKPSSMLSLPRKKNPQKTNKETDNFLYLC